MADNPEGYCIECDADIHIGHLCGECEERIYRLEMMTIMYGGE